MRLLILASNFWPEATGTAPYTTGLAAGLRARGHGVEVLTTHPHYPAWRVQPGYGQWTRRELITGVRVTRQRHYVPRDPSHVRRAISEISLGLRQNFGAWRAHDITLTVSPALLTSALARLRTLLMRDQRPFVIWVQDLYSAGMAETGRGSGAGARLVGSVERWVLRRSDVVVVIHDRFARRIIENMGVDAERVRVVRNWSHIQDDEDETVDVLHTRARLGWSPDETIVLHAGNMGVKQGLHLALDAARLAEAQSPEVRFVFLGNGSQRRALMEQSSGLTSVSFLETLPEAEFTAALRAADVLLVHELPGVSEMSVPSKLTSYFHAGRPVVAATDPDGITADEIRAAEGGEIVESGDAQGLLRAIVRVGTDKRYGDALGERGQSFRRKVLGEANAIDTFEKILDSAKRGR
ncbi:glycosyltransferase family 4 protein [Microcella alkalica]|nr:glycosyltransferase [Microcella alkalica]